MYYRKLGSRFLLFEKDHITEDALNFCSEGVSYFGIVRVVWTVKFADIAVIGIDQAASLALDAYRKPSALFVVHVFQSWLTNNS